MAGGHAGRTVNAKGIVMKMKRAAFAALTALCLVGLMLVDAMAQSPSPRNAPAPAQASPARVEFIDIRWDGVDRLCVVFPDGRVDFIGKELKSVQRPDDTDRRAFYMTLALNRMAAQGYEFVAMISDEILMKRTVR